MPADRTDVEDTLSAARKRLIGALSPLGYWPGELSASALSTATAVMALASLDSGAHGSLVRGGLEWLANNRNGDGGWGDTVASPSNISTTALCRAAFAAAGAPTDETDAVVAAADTWLARIAGGKGPGHLAEAVIARYGDDSTFSAPILAACALAGLLGSGERAWRRVPALPFEISACPHRWLRLIGLPVVSYALPALVAVGQVRHHFRPPANPLTRLIRDLAKVRTLGKLEEIQPAGGGFLEAVPLTGFVVMCLAGMGLSSHPVVSRGSVFLASAVRPDGSWPIDTNLATWVTTLSVNALAVDPDFHSYLPARQRRGILRWLLAQQHRKVHPYTGADPGGWAWTDLPGGVPDADDTAGALLAIRNLGLSGKVRPSAAVAGLEWIFRLQNRDGGVPTFCRGWGKLPFDRSSPDITAHAILAVSAWRGQMPPRIGRRAGRFTGNAMEYLAGCREKDGSWVPLWFGSDQSPGGRNVTYGTARVTSALAQIAGASRLAREMLIGGAGWLVAARNADGGWGGGPSADSSIEETALAVDALATVLARFGQSGPAGRPAPLSPLASSTSSAIDSAIGGAVSWLVDRTDAGRSFPPRPIGLYFARLWYFERLYPLIFTVSALNRVRTLRQVGTRGRINFASPV